MHNYIREPMNGFTHLAGTILAFIGLLAMVIRASIVIGTPLAIFSVIVFGVSMMLLYASSATYHMVIARAEVIAWLRKLDHSMIFVLIAGTYTPYCLITLRGPVGWSLFAVIWITAICGVLFKMIWFHCPRWLSTALYIIMGWMIIFVAAPLNSSIETTGLVLLITGGVIYTIGGVIYGTKPKWLESKYLGFHEIFHIFILLGSLAHFISVYFYVLV
ncbi:hemolysin III [Natronobacillus azotifigens]|uniref:Hemolysin III family protein n=1 Tax=Natronobacillus azotifigens TaxID=472978 RepID=A0A9J6RG26_9BACI|nr:hemolysin III family protein [Natronobacillus azotifigens]MCZ0704365.1 hemolysin III family protein [Natronobacillus azotifigens]